ncbi:hypothetical protein AGDE_07185 [Angomonas deanei]|uniref:C2 NT-type domain-containing protein n=1 Tax=Angomonas deanei TaxID=59799 RepID=A0A7G2CSW0_9TRYP|nr:hypothetical protein AGDE_07185 [Angomonas deanei]CAD2222906.1 hypothetical protein, conserved [Angomonas deanei]|eukprot:EPY35895.1 hypothetical protein AGDE_07185 [Angomonas deanei]
MGHESHIVRFRVTSLECSAMPNGQQYTIYYRRGDVARSTPCYVAQDGSVDFSSMPEGASVIHFKSGRTTRFAPKMITMRVEEFTRGQPRKAVGQVEVDCAQVVNTGYQGSGIVSQVFRLYGTTAKINVAILVYPRGAPPLNFDNLISETAIAARAVPKGNVKTMLRGEAMTLLISLETMLDRRKTETAKAPSTALELRLQELEEKRKKLISSQGLASSVVKARTQDVVAAQFTAVAYKHRNNYIGESAAYFRQIALSSAGSAAAPNVSNMEKQLDTAQSRITDLERQVAKLNEEQEALGRIQHKTDVTQELCANLDKLSMVENQLKLLTASRDSLKKELAKYDTTNDPLQKEVRGIAERVKKLEAEQQETQAKIRHMSTVATGHVLSWARAKNPPEPSETKRQVPTEDDLFSGKSDESLKDDQRKAILNAFKGMQASVPPPTARSVSSSSSSDDGNNDLFGNAQGLPSLGDFGADKKKQEPKPAYQDPFRPSGMGVDMFSAKPEPAKPAQNNAPARNDFNFAASANNREEAPKFDYNAIMQAASSQEQQTPAFSFEPAASPLQPPPSSSSPYSAFQSNASPTMDFSSPAPQSKPKQDDPYYDDIDDYTVPADIANPPAVEFGEGFSFGVDEPAAPAPAVSAAPASRPAFNFGPSEPEETQPTAPAFTLSGNPEFDFGGGGGGGGTSFGGFGSSNDNKNSGGGSGGLPTYNFGS